MVAPLTRDEFLTPAGRKRAWRELMLGDHGMLRKVYDNTHEVSAGKLWRTYQPSPRDLADWKKRGIRTVINLRGDKTSGILFLEEEACKQLGLSLVNFRAYSRDAPSKEILRNARKMFSEIEYPAIMHCKSGADRTGLMATLFLFLHEGEALDRALDQLTFKYGHVKHGKTGVIDFAFDRYISYAKDNNISLSDVDAFFEWVETKYDPVQTKKEFQPTPIGTLLTDIILRRE